MRLHLVAFIGALLVFAVVTAGLAGGASAVNPKCYRNHAHRRGSFLWWADCANKWEPHAFTERELRAAKGRPYAVKHRLGHKWLEYRHGHCAYEFNRRGQALFGVCH